MENYSVCQLQKDIRYEGFLMVRSAEKRKDVKGNDYVDMNLSDRTGEINCKSWNWDPGASAPETGSALKVRGTVQEYNGRLQLRVEKWRNTTAEDPVDMSLLVPCAPRKPEEMMAEIRETLDSFRNEKLRMLKKDEGNGYYTFPVYTPDRDGLLSFLEEAGIHCQIYYPIPIHLQKAYAHLGYRRGDFPAAEELSETGLSIPLYPGMTPDQVSYVIDTLNAF